MSKINSEDYEKIEKINLEQQKAIKENAKAVAMKEIQETVQKQTRESEKRINQIEKKSKEDVQKIATELSIDLIAKFSDNKVKENDINKMVGDQIKGKQL